MVQQGPTGVAEQGRARWQGHDPPVRLWKQESRYLGLDELPDFMEGGDQNNTVQTEVADEIAIALQQQLRFVMGFLEDFPEARSDLVDAFMKLPTPSRKTTPRWSRTSRDARCDYGR